MNQERMPFKRLTLEALAIFLGVSAGLVGDDYREYRIDREREREVLGQMLQDLEIDSDDIFPIRDQSAVRAEAMIWLNNAVADESLDLPSMTQMLDSLAPTDLYSYEASNFTYTGLKASGRLDLIRDPELRRALVFYFEDRQPAMEYTNTGLLDADRQFWERLAPYVRFRAAESLTPWPLPEVRDLGALREDGDLLYCAVNLGSWSQYQTDLTVRMLDLNRSLIAAVREYLEQIGGPA